MSAYRCPSLGDCEKANSGEVFELEVGQDLNCPACGTPMELHAAAVAGSARASGGKKGSMVALGLVAAVVTAGIAGGAFFYGKDILAKVQSKPKEDVVAMPSPIPPSAEDQARVSKRGETEIVKGNTQSSEEASRQAAAMELIKVGIAQMADKKLADAEASFKQAQALDSQQPLTHYNLAIVRLRQNRLDEAFVEMETSFQKGFKHREQMEKDTDLVSLRSDKRFAALMQKYPPAATTN